MIEDNRKFESEEELLGYVEEKVKQLNLLLDDLERAQNTETKEEFDKRWKGLYNNIVRLQNLIKQNYVMFAKSSTAVENWEELPMYSLTVTLIERLTEIKDTNTVGA
ncbi:hypothetical protein GF412_02835 [Candidatus Micrarchaeota archaeon]|nr:hypothetical protein [Candidatus Micrarchaeota archaeon]MBD3417892.1 hypothetical protein [Candidatus Micrarchaeota archaeon]